jgi:hypothetical protein
MPAPPSSGVFQCTGDGGRDVFGAYKLFPRISWRDPNLHFVELDGDGRADILITSDDRYGKSLGV